MSKQSSFEIEKHLRLAYLYGGPITYQPGQTLGPRLLTDWELTLINEGDVTYSANGHDHHVTQGSIILAKPGFKEFYRWDPHAITRHAYFHFFVEAIPEDWPDFQDWPIVCEQYDPTMVALFEHIVKRIKRHSIGPVVAPTRQDCRIVETLISLFLTAQEEETSPEEPIRPEAVNRAIKWMRELIDETPLRSITLDELSQRAGVSPKHLCRLFHTHFGHPPMRTLQLLRLQLGLALLIRSNLTIHQIAKRCGFGDQLYFTRCFTKEFAKPPSKIRKEFQQGQLPPGNLLPVDITPRIYW